MTLPHKLSVIPLVDELTEAAEAVGAVNWIFNRDGKLVGHNTDGTGFLRALKEKAGFDPAGVDVVVFGAGGAPRTLRHQSPHVPPRTEGRRSRLIPANP